jgi:hypothetical protein
MTSRAKVLAVIVAVSASGLQAQTTLIGRVRADSSQTPLAGAEVSIDALGRSTRTDESGRFVLSGLEPGLRHVQVRRIGYQSVGKMIQLVAGAEREADFLLERAVVKLDSVVVTTQRDRFMTDFEANRRIGLGHFFTRAELERQGIVQLEQAFDQIPSAVVLRFDPTKPKDKRGFGLHGFVINQRRNCLSHVYLDNSLVYSGRRDEPPFDIHLIPVDAIEAIEYYSGPAQTPAKYNTLNSNCGVVVIWTRRKP